ncbi:hypothetical protein [Leucobacter sp. OH1287]|uniref:hypothetical protein n=1 Tax=Leucobacter sp. OH1287 TaxID=2491049 RepID=UPI000F5F5189|nr:hypothetical protein [Leucobacter sp. OH1287]RRD61362.1 hypothetical protein EII30_02900 [Leucobacter sp. OH1287]
MDRHCKYCFGSMMMVRRDAKFCRVKCRVYFARELRRIPAALRAFKAWVRMKAAKPVQTNGKPASSTNRTTWTDYKSVRRSRQGDGFGVVLGRGLCCYRFKNAYRRGRLLKRVHQALAAVTEPIIYAEQQQSELLVFVEGAEQYTSRTRSYIKLTRNQVIRLTGVRYQLA